MILALTIITTAFISVSTFDVQYIVSSKSPDNHHVNGNALYANSFGVPLKNESYDYV